MPKIGCKTGVYVILNTVNGKRYIGSTVWSFKERWRRHRNHLRAGTHHSSHLQSAWNKYGEQAFRFKVLAFCSPEQCLKLEQQYLDRFHTADPYSGYNRRPTAENNQGLKWSKEAKAARSIAMKGSMTEEFRVRLRTANLGKIESPETRAKKSAAHLGKPKSAKTRANMRAAWVLRKLKGA